MYVKVLEDNSLIVCMSGANNNTNEVVMKGLNNANSMLDTVFCNSFINSCCIESNRQENRAQGG